MHQVLAIMATAVVGGIGWLLQRWLRGDRTDSILSRRLKVLRLHAQMRAAQIDVEGLRQLEKDLTVDQDATASCPTVASRKIGA